VNEIKKCGFDTAQGVLKLSFSFYQATL